MEIQLTIVLVNFTSDPLNVFEILESMFPYQSEVPRFWLKQDCQDL